MAARSGRLSKPDSQGQYARQLGWKRSGKRARTQHKFRLGRDRVEAVRRDGLLRQLWEKVRSGAPNADDALWDDPTLEIAKQVAKGADEVTLEPEPDDESPQEYARRLQSIQDRFPFLRFAPTDKQRFIEGVGERAVELSNILLYEHPRQAECNDRPELAAPKLYPGAEFGTVLRGPAMEEMLAGYRSYGDDGKTLHEALDAYSSWVDNYYQDDASGELSDYGHTKLGQIETLRSRHQDVPLSEVDYDYLEQMCRFWRQRPAKRNRDGSKGQRMSRVSAQNYLSELYRFFKWLHRSKEFTWRKPEDVDDIDRTIPMDAQEVRRTILQVGTFQLDELRLLNRYATPTERLYLLLGLNCGFGTKEIATLTVGEVFLHQALPADEQEVLGFQSTNSDSFISIVRNKTTVVGKFLLFHQTAEMLEWSMARRFKQPNPAPDQPAILNRKGKPMDERSARGNPSRQIPNAFGRLQDRIANDGHTINRLPFKHLRKTGGDLIRRFGGKGNSGGELAAIFLLHGTPVKVDKLSDVYTNRPFGKLFDVIRRVEEHLQPVFEEAGGSPTQEQPQAYTGRRAIDMIADLFQREIPVKEIAATVGRSPSAVYRHIHKLRERGELVEAAE